MTCRWCGRAIRAVTTPAGWFEHLDGKVYCPNGRTTAQPKDPS